MKLIHTSDWHLGQDFYHHSRIPEHIHFFEQILDLVLREQPDALLIAGDIYHTAAPSNEVVRLFTQWLLRIATACPSMRTVVIGGNHDSQSRLDATGDLWQLARVSVCGSLQSDLFSHIIFLPGVGYIAAVPHFYPRRDDGVGVFCRIGQQIAERNTDHLPVVCMGHLYVSGCDTEGHQRDNIGGMHAESTDIFGDFFDYVALGHIHRSQTLDGGRVRYAGSPLHVSMDENYPHTVSVVNIDSHDALPRITEHRIHQLFHAYNIPTSGSLPYDDVMALLRTFSPAEPGYVMPRVTVDSYLPQSAQKEIDALFADRPNLRFTDWGITVQRQTQSGPRHDFRAAELQQIPPLDMARIYFRDTYGAELPEDYVRKLSEIISQLEKTACL